MEDGQEGVVDAVHGCVDHVCDKGSVGSSSSGPIDIEGRGDNWDELGWDRTCSSPQIMLQVWKLMIVCMHAIVGCLGI